MFRREEALLARRGGRGGSPSPTGGAAAFDPDSLPLAIGISTAGLTLADGDTTVDSWAATYGQLKSGLVLAAPASTNRPAYSATGGVGSRPLVTFDGVDNTLTATLTKGSTWGAVECGVVGQVLGTTIASGYMIAYANTAGFRLIASAGVGDTRFETRGTGGVLSVGTTNPTTAARHYSGSWTGSSQSVRVNGTAEDTDAASPSAYADGAAVSMGGTPTGAAPLNMVIQAWYIGELLTDEERASLRAWLTAQTGITS